MRSRSQSKVLIGLVNAGHFRSLKTFTGCNEKAWVAFKSGVMPPLLSWWPSGGPCHRSSLGSSFAMDKLCGDGHPAASWISTTQFKGKLCCLIFLLDFNLVWIESIRNCKASSPGFYDRLSAHVDGAASAKRRYVRLCLPSLCTYVVLYFHGIHADISSARFGLVVAYQVQWQRLQLTSLMSWTPCKRHM